jgi:hypothetical protein
MRILVCSEDVTPCPEPSQVWVSVAQFLADAVDPALLGLTPETALKAYAFGFGSVLLMWAIGYAIGIATGMTKKL